MPHGLLSYLLPQTKQKPTPPPRSSTTCLSPLIQRKASETDGQKKAFTSDLSAVIHARSALNPSEGKAPSFPASQENTVPSITSPTPRKRTLFSTKDASPQSIVDINIPKPITPPAPPPQKTNLNSSLFPQLI